MSDTAVVTVRVPMAPPKEVSPNRMIRAAWYESYRPRQDYKLAGYHAMREVLGPRMTDPVTCFQTVPMAIQVDAIIAWEKGRKRLDHDASIGALKSVLDGIAEAMGCDDRRFVIRSCEQVRDPEGSGYTQVTLSQEATT